MNTASLIEQFAAILAEDKLAENSYEFFVNITQSVGIKKYKVNEVITSETNFMTSIIEIYNIQVLSLVKLIWRR